MSAKTKHKKIYMYMQPKKGDENAQHTITLISPFSIRLIALLMLKFARVKNINRHNRCTGCTYTPRVI